MGGCDFWRWVDPPPSSFLRELLIDLRDAVRALRMENRELQGRVGDAARQQIWPVYAAEEQRALAEPIGAETVAVVTKKAEENAKLRCRICSLEKEVFIFKFLVVTCVVVVLAMTWVNWP